MTIKYDPENKRATHVETGLAVEFLEYGYAQEQTAYFNLILDGKKNMKRDMMRDFKKLLNPIQT